MSRRWCGPCGLILLMLVLTPAGGRSQALVASDVGFDPQKRVTFNFTNRDLTDVLRQLVQLTGWSVFYDPTQVHGNVTIVTPDQIPLHHAIRLVQSVMHPYGDAIQVLLPTHSQVVPLANVLDALASPPATRQAMVWRNSDARGPQSRPYDCDLLPAHYPMQPVIVVPTP